MRYHAVTLDYSGEAKCRAETDTSDANPTLVERLGPMLREGHGLLRMSFNVSRSSDESRSEETVVLTGRWKRAGNQAEAVLSLQDNPVATLALAADPYDGTVPTVLRLLQNRVLEVVRGTAFEPAFDLLHLDGRPLLATVYWPAAAQGTRAERDTLVEVPRLIAAAYFTRDDVLGVYNPFEVEG